MNSDMNSSENIWGVMLRRMKGDPTWDIDKCFLCMGINGRKWIYGKIS